MDGVPEREQILVMNQAVEKLGEMGKTLGPMMDAWASGDTDGLAKIMNEGWRTRPHSAKALFVDRNAQVGGLGRRAAAEAGTVFMAVGAGHLPGPKACRISSPRRAFGRPR
jgi:uncharacterized protein YbaP (TraB family)